MDDLRFKLVKAFSDAFHESVNAMTSLEVKRISHESDIPLEAPLFTMITGFQGEVNGSCIIRSSAGAMLRMYEKYLGEKSEYIDSSVIDGVKELSGIINGAVSAKEQSMKLQFSPSIAVFSTLTQSHVFSKVTAVAVSYYVDDCGVFTVEVHQSKPL
jgi:CheY-specific phosphatase CheX